MNFHGTEKLLSMGFEILGLACFRMMIVVLLPTGLLLLSYFFFTFRFIVYVSYLLPLVEITTRALIFLFFFWSIFKEG